MSHEPSPWSIDALRHGGFHGFVPVAAVEPEDVPEAPGVYAVLRPSHEPPAFVTDSPEARTAQKDPAVGTRLLQRRWVEGPQVLHIGRSALGPAGRGGLRARIAGLRRFGAGEAPANRSARYAWQLADRDELLVAWNATHEDPVAVEARMQQDFAERYGRPPFANPRR